MVYRKLIIAFLISIFTGCGEADLIRIGFVGCLTGENVDLGEAARNGALLAVEDANQSKLSENKYELVVRDCKKGDQILETLTEFKLLDIDIVVGPLTSSNALQYLPFAESKGLLLISPTATSSRLTGKNDNFIRIVADNNTYAKEAAGYIKAQSDIESIVILQDEMNSDYTTNWKNTLLTDLSGSRVKAKVIEYNSKYMTDYKTLMDRALNHQPEMIVLISKATDVVRFAQHMENDNQTIPILSTEWSASEALLELGGRTVEGIYHTQFYDRESVTKDFLAFKESYRRMFKREADFSAISSYDATTIAISSLSNRDGSNNKRKIVDRSFMGLQHEIAIDENGDSNGYAFITQIINGQFHQLGK
ncbi:ABC transporter substrate-binding protein [Vibrio sp. Of7-15]|uniref:ABC transporter substrate-binding protein n=1 Tax=Vibrio sp. Of7-15 TaxID=2724879 RepID=UPI001EF3BF66|nr:ABC transporter substrate-binding protein [Vibrio sp. Of7-15]MCG7496259.1 ABC transporter substrate-binding protein [Vibrio sp. Of7-15]